MPYTALLAQLTPRVNCKGNSIGVDCGIFRQLSAGASGTLSQDWYAGVYGFMRAASHTPGNFYIHIRQGVLLLGVAPLQNVPNGLTLVQSFIRTVQMPVQYYLQGVHGNELNC